MASCEDVHKAQLIQKPLIVRLDESHREYNTLCQRLWFCVKCVYLMVAIQLVFVTWGMVKVRDQMQLVVGYLREKSQQLLILGIDGIGLQSTQGVLPYQTLSWWLLQFLILIISTLLFYKIRRWLKQFQSDGLKLVVIVALLLGAALLVRDSLGRTIMSIISSMAILVFVQIQQIIQKSPASIPPPYNTTNIKTLQQQLSTSLFQLNNRASFFSSVFDICFMIDSFALVLFSYQFFILYRSQVKCKSLISQLKQSGEFDIQPVVINSKQQQQHQFLYSSSTNSNNSKKRKPPLRNFHQDMNSTHHQHYKGQYHLQQTFPSQSSSSHSSQQLYTLRIIKQRDIPLVRYNSIGGEKNHNRNKNLQTVQFENEFNSKNNNNIKAQHYYYRTNSSHSISKNQQIAPMSSFIKPNHQHQRTKTYPQLPFIQQNQIKVLSKSHTQFYD